MLLSLRLGEKAHFDQEYIDELIKVLGESGNCFDEVWLASSYGLLSVEQCKKASEHMKLSAGKFKKAGIIPSMQISRTIGHSGSSLITCGSDGIKDVDVDYITDINGIESKGIFCWNNNNFRDYIYKSLKAYAAFKPEIVWVDDDLRIRALGKSKALCFCDNCIRLFNNTYNFEYDRKSLKNDFYNNTDIRKKYIEFQTSTLGDFAEIISKAVYEASPDSIMALQNGGNTMLAINAQKVCLDEMKRVSKKNPAFRAGGGFYDDHTPYQMLDKAIQLNYINSRLPDYVKMRSCEIENLPFLAYGKSSECTCIEASVYIAYGCNMASVTLMNKNEPLSYHKELFEKLSLYKPYLQRLARNSEETKNSGVCIYQPVKSHLSYMSDVDREAWNDTSVWEAKKLLRCGIPYNASMEGNVYFLSKKTCEYISEEDMDFLLRRNVITDAASLEKLFEAGYSDKINAKVKKLDSRFQMLCYEVATEHCINECVNLEKWADSAWYSNDVLYKIYGNGIEEVSSYRSYETGDELGCAGAVVKTIYGAKWFVKGGHLCNGMISFNRRNQIINAINYVADEPLPAYVNTAHQIVIIPRVNNCGETVSVTLLNVSITDCKNIELSVAKPANEKCIISDPYAADKEIKAEYKDGRYLLNIEEIRPWRVKTVYFIQEG